MARITSLAIAPAARLQAHTHTHTHTHTRTHTHTHARTRTQHLLSFLQAEVGLAGTYVESTNRCACYPGYTSSTNYHPVCDVAADSACLAGAATDGDLVLTASVVDATQPTGTAVNLVLRSPLFATQSIKSIKIGSGGNFCTYPGEPFVKTVATSASGGSGGCDDTLTAPLSLAWLSACGVGFGVVDAVEAITAGLAPELTWYGFEIPLEVVIGRDNIGGGGGNVDVRADTSVRVYREQLYYSGLVSDMEVASGLDLEAVVIDQSWSWVNGRAEIRLVFETQETYPYALTWLVVDTVPAVASPNVTIRAVNAAGVPSGPVGTGVGAAVPALTDRCMGSQCRQRWELRARAGRACTLGAPFEFLAAHSCRDGVVSSLCTGTSTVAVASIPTGSMCRRQVVGGEIHGASVASYISNSFSRYRSDVLGGIAGGGERLLSLWSLFFCLFVW